MKTKHPLYRLAPALLALLLLAVPSVLLADDAPAKEKKLTKNQEKYDADKDGKLSEEERMQKKADEAAAKEARKAERDAQKSAKSAPKSE